MGTVTPPGKARLTRVTKSYGDAICHRVNCWGGWPLQTPKSSKTDQILRGRPTYSRERGAERGEGDAPLITYFFGEKVWNAATDLFPAAARGSKKKKEEEAFKSRVTSLGRTLNFSPLSHASFIISVYFARRLKAEELRRSSPRLCNRHRRVSCGWIHSPGAVGHDTDVRGLSVLPSEWQEEAARRCLSRGNHSLQQYWNKKKTSARLCGKTQLWVSWSLNVSLKVNCRSKFISSDNIFVRRNEQLCFSVLPTRSLDRHLLKIARPQNVLLATIVNVSHTASSLHQRSQPFVVFFPSGKVS